MFLWINFLPNINIFSSQCIYYNINNFHLSSESIFQKHTKSADWVLVTRTLRSSAGWASLLLFWFPGSAEGGGCSSLVVLGAWVSVVRFGVGFWCCDHKKDLTLPGILYAYYLSSKKRSKHFNNSSGIRGSHVHQLESKPTCIQVWAWQNTN